MAEKHPDEVELLELVEGERPELAAHVAACAHCADRVRLLEAGRDALRGAPLLELPAKRRGEIVRRLPRRERERERRFAWRPLAVVVALAAVVAALAALAVVSSDGTGEEAGGAGAGGGEVSSPSAGEEGVTDAAALPQPLATVAGDPVEIAASLRARGFDARVRDGRVVVLTADAAAVRTALEPRRKGDVPVFVRKP